VTVVLPAVPGLGPEPEPVVSAPSAGLEGALARIEEDGLGVVLYMGQEGRGTRA